MGKLEGTIKSEIVRLAKREMRKTSVPLRRNLRLLKKTVSQIRKTVLALERFAAQQQKELRKRKMPLEATPEEVKESRFSSRLIGSLRRHLGITQKELAILTGVSVGAAHLWEIGQFKPSMKKKAVMVALRKLGRREVRKLLEEKESQMVEKKASSRRRKRTRRVRGK
jgi:DNA-binding transcriptional regulator YiaG